MKPLRLLLPVSIGALVACGPAPGYGPDERSTTTTSTYTATTTTTGSAVVHAPAGAATTQQGQVVVHQPANQTPVIVVPMPTPTQQVVVQQAPTPAAVVAPPTAPVAAVPAPNAAFVCSGNQRLNLVNRHVNGEGRIAVHASGNCHVTINEAILRGEPAVVAVGNAQVDVIESRIYGDLVSQGNAQVSVRGSRHHEGQVVNN